MIRVAKCKGQTRPLHNMPQRPTRAPSTSLHLKVSCLECIDLRKKPHFRSQRIPVPHHWQLGLPHPLQHSPKMIEDRNHETTEATSGSPKSNNRSAMKYGELLSMGESKAHIRYLRQWPHVELSMGKDNDPIRPSSEPRTIVQSFLGATPLSAPLESGTVLVT